MQLVRAAAKSLFLVPQPKPGARVRLVCFPYAGGGVATYIPWLKALSPDVELAIAQLPGRGARLNERPHHSMDDLVKDLFFYLAELPTKPLVFFGHSMGACVAYELALMLLRFNYRLPVHVIVSASAAPWFARTRENIHGLSDEDFIAKVKELGGSPEGVLEDPELVRVALPSLRADFTLIETYRNNGRVVIPVPVSVFAGCEDGIEEEKLAGWFRLFSGNTGVHRIEGDHFFVDKNRKEVLKEIQSVLDKSALKR